jgi:hypothetical protein
VTAPRPKGSLRASSFAALAALVAFVAIGWPGWALAQGLEVTARASATRVEVGEPFTIELHAMSDGNVTPSTPELRAPAGLRVMGPDVSSQTVMQIGGGGARTRTGLGATWELTASGPGHYVIPGPSVVANGKRVSASALAVDVVPASGRPRASQQPSPSNPFLLPGGPMGWPFGRGTDPFGADPFADTDTDDDADRALAMDTAPDPKLFLRAIADKTSAVVGEQVTVSFYVYYRVDFEMTERHDASLSDFVRVPLLKNPGADPTVYAVAGGHRYGVRMLDKIALFPVRAGSLHTGSMSGRFNGRRIGSRVSKSSNDLVIDVREPPRKDRPAGYALGDVGQFSLTASVAPRQVDQGGSIGVTLKVSGTGNLPESLHVPARTGVEWLDPEKKESIEPRNDVVGGYRTFGYVVRLGDSGDVDLGTVELPFWDPAAKKYQVARAALGVVHVTPSAVAPAHPSASADPSAPSEDRLASLPSPRKALGAFEPSRPSPLDGGRFWFLLASPPLLVGFAFAGSRAAKGLRERRTSAKTSPAALASAALRDLDEAEARGDAGAVATAAERAIHQAIEAATGLKSRGVLVADLPAELDRRGVAAELAARVGSALAACDALRFDPAASASAMGELASDARTLSREIARSGARR